MANDTVAEPIRPIKTTPRPPICGQEYGECEHIIERPYLGKLCERIRKKFKATEISAVDTHKTVGLTKIFSQNPIKSMVIIISTVVYPATLSVTRLTGIVEFNIFPKARAGTIFALSE
jgi:hypothetical protein